MKKILVSALRGGSGKTVVTAGIISALVKNGIKVSPFKKGPDYIDTGWLARAAGRPCYNLDPFFMSKETILESFLSRSAGSEIAIVEGNRGLFDGIDVAGTTSTAELAKLLGLPVVLCLDCTKTTRTAAALVLGCKSFDRDVNIAGVILNRVAGPRHESILTRSIEHHCNIPVIGAIPKLKKQDFPERHMGLVPVHEHERSEASIESSAKIIEEFVDIKKIIGIAETGTSITGPVLKKKDKSISCAVKIGVIRDMAFQFYYPENLEALEAAGAEIIFFSAFETEKMPDVDGLYIGGGFPETNAGRLSENQAFLMHLKEKAGQGLPVYAECGGLIYLGECLVMEGGTFPMAGVFPIVFGFSKRPDGHGYTEIEVVEKNPYHSTGRIIRGHEFHYSSVLECRMKPENFAFKMKRGKGMTGGLDGVCHRNVLAAYTHIHALSVPEWAKAFVRTAQNYREEKGAAE